MFYYHSSTKFWRLVGLTFDLSNHSIHLSIIQSITQSVNQSANQSINQSLTAHCFLYHPPGPIAKCVPRVPGFCRIENIISTRICCFSNSVLCCLWVIQMPVQIPFGRHLPYRLLVFSFCRPPSWQRWHFLMQVAEWINSLNVFQGKICISGLQKS